MMKIIDKAKILVAGLAIALIGVGAPVMATEKAQVVCPANSPSNANKLVSDISQCGLKDTLMPTLQVVINVVIGVIGFVTVAMIVLGGVQYTTSAGDASKVKTAKNTIMYGIVGLIIALLAYAIVNFVMTGIFSA